MVIKSDFTAFKKHLESSFGRPLTNTVEIAALDFWNHWDDLYKELKSENITIGVDFLTIKNQVMTHEYNIYSLYKVSGQLIRVVGVIFLFFINWITGLVLIVVGTLLIALGKNYKQKKISEFVNKLKSNLHKDEYISMLIICSHYLAGTITLSKENIVATIPVFPSSCLTGKLDFID